MRALADSNASFATNRQKILNATQARTAYIDNLILSYQSVNDLMEKARKGVVYFENLNEPVGKLFDEVKDFCHKSKQERENKLKIMQRVSSLANNGQQQQQHALFPGAINQASDMGVNNYRPKQIPPPQFNSGAGVDNSVSRLPPDFNQQLNVAEITQMMSTLPGTNQTWVTQKLN